jgi:hypothetical protein
VQMRHWTDLVVLGLDVDSGRLLSWWSVMLMFVRMNGDGRLVMEHDRGSGGHHQEMWM